MKRAATIGFDRRLRREWLDAIASMHAAGAPRPELREFGDKLLRAECPAAKARRNSLTVLLHLWVDVPAKAIALRDSASKLLSSLDQRGRIALHWGLGLATYPFFRDAADAAGRLVALQGSVSLAQIQRRLAERWGQRSTTERAAQRMVRSWVDWDLLREGKQRGTYIASKPLEVSGLLALWIVEAVLVGADAEWQAVDYVRRAPQLFPFAVKVSAYELRHAPRLEVHRQGANEDVVALYQSYGRGGRSTDPMRLRLPGNGASEGSEEETCS